MSFTLCRRCCMLTHDPITNNLLAQVCFTLTYWVNQILGHGPTYTDPWPMWPIPGLIKYWVMGQHTPTHGPCDPSQEVTHLTHDPSTHCLLWLVQCGTDWAGCSSSLYQMHKPSRRRLDCTALYWWLVVGVCASQGLMLKVGSHDQLGRLHGVLERCLQFTVCGIVQNILSTLWSSSTLVRFVSLNKLLS